MFADYFTQRRSSGAGKRQTTPCLCGSSKVGRLAAAVQWSQLLPWPSTLYYLVMYASCGPHCRVTESWMKSQRHAINQEKLVGFVPGVAVNDGWVYWKCGLAKKGWSVPGVAVDDGWVPV